MALIYCRECGTQISEHAIACPKCGHPNSTRPPALRDSSEIANVRYRSYYRSQDNRQLLGLCGGLAHKFGVPPFVMRLLGLIAFFFWIPLLLYPFSLLLPTLPTRDVPRVQ